VVQRHVGIHPASPSRCYGHHIDLYVFYEKGRYEITVVTLDTVLKLGDD
jgi:hypothetical protein